jgi:PilZ domain
MSADPNRLERRGAQRFEVHQPLAIRVDGRTVPGFIQDLSSRGIFFYAQAALAEGTVVELTFIMPREITLSDNMPVRCRGRVLRALAPKDGQRNGIAVHLDSYEYLPADEHVTQFVRVSASSQVAADSEQVSR